MDLDATFRHYNTNSGSAPEFADEESVSVMSGAASNAQHPASVARFGSIADAPRGWRVTAIPSKYVIALALVAIVAGILYLRRDTEHKVATRSSQPRSTTMVHSDDPLFRPFDWSNSQKKNKLF